MPKVDLNLVKMIMNRNDIDTRKVASIIEELKVELQREAEAEKPPPVKKQYVILVSDPEKILDSKDLTGWVVQIPEEESATLTERKIIDGSYDYNASPKGRQMPVESIGEACEIVTSKFFKERKIWIKTKEPILLITTDNQIPEEPLHPL